MKNYLGQDNPKALKEAQQIANAACAMIHFDGAHYRKDIGFRVIPA